MMQKQVSTNNENTHNTPFTIRDQQFSFVMASNTNQPNGHIIHTNIGLSRQIQKEQQRPYELTFQNKNPDTFILPIRLTNQSLTDHNIQNNIGKQIEQQIQKESQYELRHTQKYKNTQYLSSFDKQQKSQTHKQISSIIQSQTKLQQVKAIRLSYLIKKSDSNNEYVELDCQIPNIYQSEILLNKDIEDYSIDRANLCDSDYIQFIKFKISIIGIHKIKIYADIVKKKSFRIKINHQKEIYNLGVQLRRELYLLPEHYIWFAKLINARLMKNGCKLQLKNNKNAILQGNGIYNQGVIYKCSKYRKKWQKRFILINNQGLFSYKNPKQNYTVSIPSSTLEELWTNFQLFGSNLIIKVRHKGQKTEFAIPILDYCLKQDASNWLFAFYRLLMQHKIHIKI